MNNYSPLMPYGPEDPSLATYWNPQQSITETSFSTMAKDTRVTFDSAAPVPAKHTNKPRPHRVPERQISYEDAENCVNEMSESFPALSTRAHRLMRQVSGTFNSRTIKVALILSVILNLLLGIPFGIFFGFWMSQKNDSPSAMSASSQSASDALSRLSGDRSYALMESCFPCNDFEPGSRVKVRSKNNICCTDDKIPSLEGSAYFYLSAEYYKKKVVGPSDRASIPCIPSNGVSQDSGQVSAAHMMLDVKQTKLNVKGHGISSKIPLSWISQDPEKMSFIGDGVSYLNGQLTVRHPGKYHIYSHVTFSTNENPLSDHEEEKIIVHSILRQSRGDPSTLLFAQVTMKHNEARSTNIEGSFDLLEGDVISVYVSHPSFLKDTLTANVFGLFKL